MYYFVHHRNLSKTYCDACKLYTTNGQFDAHLSRIEHSFYTRERSMELREPE